MTSYANFRTILVNIVVSAFEYSTCSVFCYLLVKYNYSMCITKKSPVIRARTSIGLCINIGSNC